MRRGRVETEIVSDYYDWYNSLDPVDDLGKIIAADRVLTPNN